MPFFSAITTFIDALATPGLNKAPEQIKSIQLRLALVTAAPIPRAHTRLHACKPCGMVRDFQRENGR